MKSRLKKGKAINQVPIPPPVPKQARKGPGRPKKNVNRNKFTTLISDSVFFKADQLVSKKRLDLQKRDYSKADLIEDLITRAYQEEFD